jgi:hypothetical protein
MLRKSGRSGSRAEQNLSTGRKFASCLTWHGEFAEAEEYNRNVLNGIKRAFRTEHPKAIKSASNLRRTQECIQEL